LAKSSRVPTAWLLGRDFSFSLCLSFSKSIRPLRWVDFVETLASLGHPSGTCQTKAANRHPLVVSIGATRPADSTLLILFRCRGISPYAMPLACKRNTKTPLSAVGWPVGRVPFHVVRNGHPTKEGFQMSRQMRSLWLRLTNDAAAVIWPPRLLAPMPLAALSVFLCNLHCGRENLFFTGIEWLP